GAEASRVADVPGVAVAPPQATVPIAVTVGHGAYRRTYYSGIVAVDPAAYRRTYRRPPRSGSLAALRGRTIAVGPGLSEEGLRRGGVAVARIGERRVRLRIVAVMAPVLENGADGFILPRELIPQDVIAKAPTRTVVQVAPG